MGLWEWNFCLKLLSTPTKTLLLLFERRIFALNVGQKITNIQSIYHILMLLSCILFRPYYSIGFYESGLFRYFCNFVIKKVLRNIKNALPFHLLAGYPIQIIVFDFRNFYARYLPVKQIKMHHNSRDFIRYQTPFSFYN